MTIEGQIRDYIASNMLFSDNGYPYDDSTSFLEEGIVDSTGVLELILFVEESFGVQVADEDVTPNNFDSVAQLATYIRSKVSVRA
jgi:acyl carrier protein